MCCIFFYRFSFTSFFFALSKNMGKLVSAKDALSFILTSDSGFEQRFFLHEYIFFGMGWFFTSVTLNEKSMK